MKILAVNAGSSSLKFQLIEMPEEKVIASGQVERIMLPKSVLTIKYNGEKYETIQDVPTHTDAVNLVMSRLKAMGIIENVEEIKGVGHRVVQGGESFSKTEVVTPEVEKEVLRLAKFAPHHNKVEHAGYLAFKNALPNAIHTMVFDTAFHQTIPEERYVYPIPYKYYKEDRIRRYGAHGTSHKYIASVIQEYYGKENYKLINCHLGSGASICAIKDGKSVDTSMGFTPLGGIMMGTRCGDLDPSVISYVMELDNLTPEQMNHMCNYDSGLLGVSGISSDMRDIDKGELQGIEQAFLARKVYCTRVAQFIGSYFVELGGCDAIVFTAGVGENSIKTRQCLIPMLQEALQIEVDEEHATDILNGKGRKISTDNSKIDVFVIPTNEEIMMCRDTYEIVLKTMGK